ncbi:hypothetical protein J6590_049619 [Homalodisca vitripennis]|nr:hypothetical protein J6590_049619 [Homalodisca vitripennis]
MVTTTNGRAGGLLARTGSLIDHPSKQQPRLTLLYPPLIKDTPHHPLSYSRPSLLPATSIHSTVSPLIIPHLIQDSVQAGQCVSTFSPSCYHYTLYCLSPHHSTLNTRLSTRRAVRVSGSPSNQLRSPLIKDTPHHPMSYSGLSLLPATSIHSTYKAGSACLWISCKSITIAADQRHSTPPSVLLWTVSPSCYQYTLYCLSPHHSTLNTRLSTRRAVRVCGSPANQLRSPLIKYTPHHPLSYSRLSLLPATTIHSTVSPLPQSTLNTRLSTRRAVRVCGSPANQLRSPLIKHFHFTLCLLWTVSPSCYHYTLYCLLLNPHLIQDYGQACLWISFKSITIAADQIHSTPPYVLLWTVSPSCYQYTLYCLSPPHSTLNTRLSTRRAVRVCGSPANQLRSPLIKDTPHHPMSYSGLSLLPATSIHSTVSPLPHSTLNTRLSTRRAVRVCGSPSNQLRSPLIKDTPHHPMSYSGLSLLPATGIHSTVSPLLIPHLIQDSVQDGQCVSVDLLQINYDRR